MTEDNRRGIHAVAKQAVLLSAIYAFIAWRVFFHESAETGLGQFWPPAKVYANYVAEGRTGLYAFPLFLFGYLFPFLSLGDLARVWRREHNRCSESAAD